MARLILFLLFFAVAVLAAASVMTFFRTAGRVMPANSDEDSMPATFRLVAYLLLLALMVGVATGWLGAV